MYYTGLPRQHGFMCLLLWALLSREWLGGQILPQRITTSHHIYMTLSICAGETRLAQHVPGSS